MGYLQWCFQENYNKGVAQEYIPTVMTDFQIESKEPKQLHKLFSLVCVFVCVQGNHIILY